MPSVSGPQQQAVLCRMVCLYLIGHLANKPLYEACEALYDIYARQEELNRFVPELPQHRTLAVNSVIHRERAPFIMDNDL